MDKDTKIELLKILGMIIILAVLIWGIIWINTDNTSTDVNNTIENESSEEEVVENTDNQTSENSTNETVNETEE